MIKKDWYQHSYLSISYYFVVIDLPPHQTLLSLAKVTRTAIHCFCTLCKKLSVVGRGREIWKMYFKLNTLFPLIEILIFLQTKFKLLRFSTNKDMRSWKKSHKSCNILKLFTFTESRHSFLAPYNLRHTSIICLN